VLASLSVHVLLLIGPGLTNSRVLYLGSVGLAMVIGALLTSVEGARMRTSCALVILLAFGFLLQHNLEAWRWASDLSERFLAELHCLEPSPPANAEFVVFDPPDTIRGVFFFHVRLAEGKGDLRPAGFGRALAAVASRSAAEPIRRRCDCGGVGE
jgi:hypothetical protein